MDNELNTLRHLFKHIPALSSPSGQAILPFSIDYELDPEKVEYFEGSESDALNQVLEVCFSDRTRYNVTFEQLDLNVNSRALAKLLTDNPEQPDTSILSDKPTETLPPYMISERDRGEYGNPFDM